MIYIRAKQGAYIICEHHGNRKVFPSERFRTATWVSYQSLIDMHGINKYLLYIIYMQEVIMTGQSLHLM